MTRTRFAAPYGSAKEARHARANRLYHRIHKRKPGGYGPDAASQGDSTEFGAADGIAVVFAPGSTAGVTTVEFEPGLEKDIDLFLERIVPYGGRYHHHETWHDDNGSSHLQAALIGPSVAVPFVKGEPVLGTWQQVVLIDCDTRPRNRKIVVQMVY